MNGFYDPWQTQPHQLPSNLIRPRPSTQTDTRVSASPLPGAPRTPSPQPVVIVEVRMRLDEQHIQFQTLPQSNASPSPAAGHWRGGRSLTWRSLLASFSRHEGPFLGRSKFLGAFKAPRTSSLLNSSQEPSSGLSNTFHLLVRLLGLHDRKRTIGDVAPCAEKLSIRSVK